MTDEKARRWAKQRSALHEGQASRRVWVSDYELKGIAGEKALADWCGTTVQQLTHKRGDDGKDQIIWFRGDDGRPIRCKTDVKCAEVPEPKLWVEKHKADDPEKRAKVYIVARYYPATETAILLRWTWLGMVLRAPVVVTPKGSISYEVPFAKLRDLGELRTRFIRVEPPEEAAT